MKQRLDYIDIAKGIGIILVVLSHTRYSEIMYYTSAFYVSIFFFCSGYTSSPIKDISLKENFWRHAVKLLKPYLFFSVLLLIIFHNVSLRAFAGIVYSRYCLYPFGTEPDIVRFMIIGNYPLWFLTCMVVAYFLYYQIIYHPKYQYYIATSYLLVTVALSQLPILLPWSIDTAFLMALLMYAGNLTRKYIPAAFGLRPHPIVIISIVMYFVLLPLCNGINLSVREYGLSVGVCLLAALFGSIAVIYISRLLENTIIGKVIRQIGKHSLTIFCIQIPFILIGKHITEWIFDDIAKSQFTLVMTAIIEATTAILGGYLVSLLLQWNNKIKSLVF